MNRSMKIVCILTGLMTGSCSSTDPLMPSEQQPFPERFNMYEAEIEEIYRQVGGGVR